MVAVYEESEDDDAESEDGGEGGEEPQSYFLDPIDAAFVSRDGQQTGTLTTTVEVREYPPYEGVKRLQADLSLRPRGKGKGKKMRNVQPDPGYFVGWLVDKTLLTDRDKPWWIQELLYNDALDDDDLTGELRQVFRKLFFKNGNPRKTQGLKHHQEGLEQRRIIPIDTFLLENRWRGTGLAQLALESFHAVMEDELFRVRTMVLSPARLDGSDWGVLNDVEFEERLVRIYEASNYEIWILGARHEPGSMTVMGRVN